MTEKQWETLIDNSKVWVSEDRGTKIKFTSFPGHVIGCELTYVVNDGEEKHIPVHISISENEPRQKKSFNIAFPLYIIWHSGGIEVNLPELKETFLVQVES